MKRKLETPVLHRITFTTGDEIVSRDAKFYTQKGALSFFNAMNSETATLTAASSPDLLRDLLQINEQAASQIQQILHEVTMENLNATLDTVITYPGGALTNDIKIGHIIAKYTQKDNVQVMCEWVIESIEEVDNSALATKLASALLQRLHILSLRTRVAGSLAIDTYSRLTQRYPETYSDMDLKSLVVRCSVSAKDVGSAYAFLQELADAYHTPTPEIMESYLELLVKKVDYHDRTHLKAMKLLEGLDQVLFSTFSIKSCKSLLSLSTHPDEVSALLDIAEAKFGGQSFKELEDNVATALFKFKRYRLKHAAIKMGVILRLKKYIGLSSRTKKLMLVDAVKEGSFILAEQLLKGVELTTEEVNQLKRYLADDDLQSDVKQRNLAPGRDSSSQAELLKALNLYIS